MSFLLPRPSLRPPFKLEDHWAGGLPDQAQEVIDMFLYPEVYEHFGSHLPKGYSPPSLRLTAQRSSLWPAWDREDSFCPCHR